jgi:hypothetical protein
MAHKVDGNFSAQAACTYAAQNTRLNFDKISTLEGCRIRINEIAHNGGLACQCNLKKRDTQLLTKAGFTVKPDRCLNPYADSKETIKCYVVFWNAN